MNSVNEALDKIIALAKEVGGAAWPILVKKATVESTVWCCSGIVMVVLALVLLLFAVKLHRDDDEACISMYIAAVFFGLFAGSIIAMNLPGAIYPEGAAIGTLMRNMR